MRTVLITGASSGFGAAAARSFAARGDRVVAAGVRVTCIEPGLVGGTEFSDVRLGDSERAGQVYAGTEPLTADDIAAAIDWATSQPPHVNINVIELMPVAQSSAPLQLDRRA